MKYKNILFDLDGVISDNSEGITNGVRRVINHFCLREQTHEELLRFIGPPLIDSFCNYLGLSKAEAELGVRIYREYYKDRGIFENVMYAGIPEMLERLKRSKLQLYLATSKPEKFARRICERFGIAKYFTYIGGATLDGNRTKKSDVIRYVLECQKITASESIMVGDRHYDVEGAAECSLPCIGVLYGFGSCEELAKAGCNLFAETPFELGECLLSGLSHRDNQTVRKHL